MAFRARKTFETELRGQPEFQAALRSAARTLESAVVFMAAPFAETGYFVRHVKARGNRVLLTDPFWHLSEYGSIHNPPQGNVRRAVRASGLRYEDGRSERPGV